MSDIKLFQMSKASSQVTELQSRYARLEKDLQQLVESNMETCLGVSFLASEFVTSNRDRIDSLGLDENGCPVIIEYKRNSNQNVINQGLFYYDWLLDHKADFQLLVMNTLGKEKADNIEWGGARLICIAADFTKYDEHAIKQIDKNIELVRYKYFAEDLFLLELVNTQTPRNIVDAQSQSQQQNDSPLAPNNKANKKERSDYHATRKQAASEALLSMYETICEFGLSLGEEVQRKELKFYTALKKIKNFASVQVWAPQQDPSLRIYLHLNPEETPLMDGVVNDARNKGHWGTGDLEVIVKTQLELELAMELMQTSFEKN